ncbi:ribosome biogenesis GTPase Der [Nitrosomonas ureae]|uniref:GTPase Der n=1 Tax=Nitrosomonas ureae TaxID=44577 RepID=A0A0S3AJI9_9PROT|nr:ribosome biogenesis GTPase Der [Nitrosomonas ureae]ALQ51353.1 ribosome-associated GTPase EngA [Nitrosomonas ureae]PTQ80440.1 GTP-binding protein [Nitrosomonas ureae]PXX15565.1 GTP-binding protein [Nitrosomonas ureae]SDU05788.1 GTP-binding protein [Nitrosomonas ureae]SEQ24553.1 GTP-binding protein [Nitrosomonas ureae]
MKPTLVLVGRPNVGKSTLFNRLTRTRDAIVADIPGLTRDRHYGAGRVGDKPYLVMDTGGFEPVIKEGILHAMAKQTIQAIDEADRVLFIVDGRQGLTAHDKIIAEQLRKSGQKILLVVNKTEGMATAVVTAEFFELGLGDPCAVSAMHGDNINELADLALADFPEVVEEFSSNHPKIAIVGRPNVGKSTLINTLLGEERVIAFDQPGTTRDSIYVDFTHKDKQYTLIDTAGLRRRGQVHETIEKFSAIKTLQAIEDANVVVLILDAKNEISDQDAHIAGFILEMGRALVIAVNKWDGLDEYQRATIKSDLSRKLAFLSFAQLHYISALHGTGIKKLLPSIDIAYAAAMADLPTPKLTRVLIAAVEKHPPPRGGMSRPKMRYAHQGGSNPPLIIIHGSMLNHVPETYRRYLENTFREIFKLWSTPLRVDFKIGHNPYADKKPAPPTEAEARRAHSRRRRNRKKYG